MEQKSIFQKNNLQMVKGWKIDYGKSYIEKKNLTSEEFESKINDLITNNPHLSFDLGVLEKKSKEEFKKYLKTCRKNKFIPFYQEWCLDYFLNFLEMNYVLTENRRYILSNISPLSLTSSQREYFKEYIYVKDNTYKLKADEMILNLTPFQKECFGGFCLSKDNCDVFISNFNNKNIPDINKSKEINWRN